MVLNIITAVLSVAIALIIELTINIVSTEQMDDFRRIVFGALIFIVLYFGFNYLRNFYMQRMINRYIGQLRSLLFRKIMSYSFVGFRKSSTSDYLSLLTNDIQIYQEGIVRSKLCVVQNVSNNCTAGSIGHKHKYHFSDYYMYSNYLFFATSF